MTMLRARIADGRPAHLWFRSGDRLFGAYGGTDGGWRAAAWALDGRPTRGGAALALEPLPDLRTLEDRCL